MLFKLTSFTRSQLSSVISTGPPTSTIPTLLCSTSIRPNAAIQALTMAETSSARDTSAETASHIPPSPSMIRLVSSAASRLISTARTLAPSLAKSTAVALPLPQPGPLDPAPETSATLSLSRSPMLSSSVGQESLARYEPPLIFDFCDSGTAGKILALEMSTMSRITPATMALGRLGNDFELVVCDHDAGGPMTGQQAADALDEPQAQGGEAAT